MNHHLPTSTKAGRAAQSRPASRPQRSIWLSTGIGANFQLLEIWASKTPTAFSRNLPSSLRACLAAEAWKRLHPEGAPGKGKRTDLKPKCKTALTFEDFARANFKTGERYAKQALAILNHSAELLPRPAASKVKPVSPVCKCFVI